MNSKLNKYKKFIDETLSKCKQPKFKDLPIRTQKLLKKYNLETLIYKESYEDYYEGSYEDYWEWRG